jgi:ribonuclease BN (tRNA processing enzyme)
MGNEMGTWKEFVLLRERNVVQMFNLLEHGRRSYRSLVYSTDTRFCLRSLEPETRDR